MKRLILPAFAILVVLVSCNQKKQYTESSPEIETYKKVVADYENRDWNDFITHYADSAKILIHVTDKDAITAKQLTASNKETANSFKEWKYATKSFFMVMYMRFMAQVMHYQRFFMRDCFVVHNDI